MITQTTKLKVKNKTISMQEFMDMYALTTMDQAIATATVLIKQGKISVSNTKVDEFKEEIERAIEKESIHAVVHAINTEEQAYKNAQRDKMAQDIDLVSIGLAFKTTIEACSAETWINSLGIKDTEISIKSGAIVLKVKDITPQEYTKIARKYQIENTLKNGVELTGKALNSVTGAINYTATEVIAPVAKLAGEAGMNIGKGIVHTGIKVGAGLVNSGAKAYEDTVTAVTTDAEMLRATEQLKDAGDTMKRFFKSKFGNKAKRNGIEFLD